MTGRNVSPQTRMAPCRLATTAGPAHKRQWAMRTFLVVCVFWINFFLFGLIRSAALLYMALVTSYNSSHEEASWPLTLTGSTICMIGPVSALLVRAFSVRTIAAWGVLIASAGCALCYWATSVSAFILLVGGLYGIGTGLACTLTPIYLNERFEPKDRAFACGISFAGTTIGSFFWPYLLQWLIDEYTLKTSMIVYGGLMLNALFGVYFLKDGFGLQGGAAGAGELSSSSPSSPATGPTTAPSLSLISEKVAANGSDHAYLAPKRDAGTRSACDPSNQSAQQLHHYQHQHHQQQQQQPVGNGIASVVDDKHACSNGRHVNGLTSKGSSRAGPPLTNASSQHQNGTSRNGNAGGRSVAEKYGEQRLWQNGCANGFTPASLTNGKHTNGALAVLADDATLPAPGDVTTTATTKLVPSEHNYLQRNQLQQNQHSHQQQPQQQQTDTAYPVAVNGKGVKLANARGAASASEALFKHVVARLRKDFAVMTDGYFLLISASEILFFFVYTTVFVVIPDYAVDKGIDRTKAVNLITIFSISDLISKPIPGMLTCNNSMSTKGLLIMGSISMGLVCFILPYTYSYAAFSFLTFIYGLVTGGLVFLNPVLIQDYIREEHTVIAFGLSNFFVGVTGFLRPPFIGYFKDTFDNYDGLFFAMSVVSMAAAAFWLIEPVIQRSRRRRADRKRSVAAAANGHATRGSPLPLPLPPPPPPLPVPTLLAADGEALKKFAAPPDAINYRATPASIPPRLAAASPPGAGLHNGQAAALSDAAGREVHPLLRAV